VNGPPSPYLLRRLTARILQNEWCDGIPDDFLNRAYFGKIRPYRGFQVPGIHGRPEYIEEKRWWEIAVGQIWQKLSQFPEYGIFRRKK